MHGFSCRTRDSGERIELVDVCFPDFFYAFEMFQQNRFSFFADTRYGIQFGLQRGFGSALAVKRNCKTMRLVSDPL